VKLFAFGFGYTAAAVARVYRDPFTAIVGTSRSPDEADSRDHRAVKLRRFSDWEVDEAIRSDLHDAEAVLVSVPPSDSGDLVLANCAEMIAAAPRVGWVGYLSTIGVYGDHGGAWVDESTRPAPMSARSRSRLAAEEAWLEWGRRSGKAVHVFRLAGIYGPRRNTLANLAAGTAQRIIKRGQVFNRIHVDDAASALIASMRRPRAGAVYNVADDEPAPPQDVVAHAARLLGVDPPSEVPLETAELSPMAASFYAENKRASNELIKRELALCWRYPTYREGLAALRSAGEGAQAA
jgi:nucleoside-diphosphate-sugar epimerase